MNTPTINGWNILINGSITTTSEKEEELKDIKLDRGKMSVFPMTDVQYSYWIGRDDEQPLGGVGCHAYMEFDGENVEPLRLERAWKQLFKTHSMMRAKFYNGVQEVMQITKFDFLTINDFTNFCVEETEEHLIEFRDEISHRKLRTEIGETAGLALSLLPDNKTRIHFDVDMLVCDAQSIRIIIRDLANIYVKGTAPDVNPEWNFGSYLKNTEISFPKEKKRAKEYWDERIDSLPLRPELPLENSPAKLKKSRYSRHAMFLSTEKNERLQLLSNKYHVTPSMVLLTVYAEILERWSSQANFMINVPLFNRRMQDKSVENVIADFTTLTLLEIDFSEKESFINNLKKISSQFYKDMDYTAYSGVQVLRSLASKYPGEHDFAPVVFSCTLGTELISSDFIDNLGNLSYMISQTPQVWIDCQVFEVNDQLMLSWDTPDGLFPENMIDDMFSSFEKLINLLVCENIDWSRNMEYLDDAQLERIEGRAAFNLPTPTKTLIDEFFRNVKSNPTKTALIDSETDRRISYDELAESAHKIGALLKENSVKQGDKVAFTLPRGICQIEAALGIISIGACYVPVSASQPAQRRNSVHKSMDIRYVLTDRKTESNVIFPEGVVKINMEDMDACVPIETVKVSPYASAYIILTSGSTGEPKGVEISHYGAWNTIEDINKRYKITYNDVVLAISAMDFDLSVYDVFGTLSAGGTLIILSEENRRNASVWIELIEKYGVTVWNSVPILMKMLLTFVKGKNRKLPSLRVAMLSGDWIGLEIPSMLKKISESCRLVAMGGATESSIWSNYFDVELPLPEKWVSIPYGHGLTNQSYRVMDLKGRPCPDWVAGELWIGGAGIAKGYCGDPALTEKKFVDYNGERWYRTGDLGCYWSDGIIEFLGRTDFQVKIRGHRIELGEIESALKANENIKDAIVISAGEKQGEHYLVGYVVMNDNIPYDPEVIREYIEKVVPSYMIPAAFVQLDRIPITANGKLDRKHLPKLQMVEKVYVAAETETQKIMVEIWSKLFGTEKISVDDNYFRLGGDSLFGIRMATELDKRLHVELSLPKIFELPVLRNLAKYIDSLAVKKEKQIPELLVDIDSWNKEFPLSDIQYAYWVGSQGEMALGGTSTHCYFEFDCGKLDEERLNKTWNQLVKSIGMMRDVILKNGKQKILEEVPEYKIKKVNLTNKTEYEKNEILEKIRNEMSNESFNPSNWPLFRVVHSVIAGGKERIHIAFDNMVFDGWSVFYVIEEWTKYYKNEDYESAPLEISYRDYVMSLDAMKTHNKYIEDKEYWTNRLAELKPSPELPLKKSPEMLKNQTFIHLRDSIPTDEWSRIKQITNELSVTPSCVLLTVYSEILARWCRKSEFSINLTQFNRLFRHTQINDIVGDFTIPIILSINLKNAKSFLKRVEDIQKQVIRDMEHPFFGGVEIQRELAKYTGGEQRTIPVVFTSMLGIGSLNDEKMLGSLSYTATQTPQVWLDYQAIEKNGELYMGLEAVREMFEYGMPEEIFEAFIETLHILANDKSLWTKSLSSIVKFNQVPNRECTPVPLPTETLDKLFVDRVGRNGQKIAVISSGKVLTYKELFERASAVSVKIEKGSIVAIVMKKGWEQVVAAMGTLIAGATYMPIDPDNPDERKKAILEGSKATVVLLQSSIKEQQLSFINGQKIICVDEIKPIEVLSENYNSKVSNTEPAYIIFTSGSTGVPKGVVISHQGALNTIVDVNARFGITENDRTISLSNLNFDLSVYDIFGMLCIGGTVIIPDNEKRRDPMHWMELINNYGVTVWNTVPAFMQMLTEYANEKNINVVNKLKTVLLSGDWIPLDLAANIRKVFSDETNIISLGGATEASIWSNYYIIHEVKENWNSVPYGYPLTNQKFRILNDQLEDCPANVPGRLYIGGSGLALCYFNDKINTEKKFLIHPVTHERLYDTGDLGKFWPDGTIEFLGRDDFQVKIRGHRIELGEIESALRNLSYISDAIVVANESKVGEKYLTGYVVTGEENFNSDTLTEYLSKHVPAYMVPVTFMRLDNFPITVNGKIDRKMLPKPDEIVRKFVEPETETERILCKIWCKMFQIEKISVLDSYFILGGDSLMGIHLISEIESYFGRQIALGKIFEMPVLKNLAAYIESFDSASKNRELPELIVNKEAWDEPFPLTDIQHAYWIGSQNNMSLGGTSTHCYFELECNDINLNRLNKCWNKIIKSQGMMRAIIISNGMQLILNEVPEYKIEAIDLGGLDKIEVAKKRLEIRDNMSQESCNPSVWPLFCLCLSDNGSTDQILHVAFDNIIFDGWSVFFVLEELSNCYKDDNYKLDELEISYRDYVMSLNGIKETEKFNKDKEYWINRLDDIYPKIELPIIADADIIKEHTFLHLKGAINHNDWAKIKQAAMRNNVTPSCVLIAAYVEALGRWCCKTQFTINLTQYNRLFSHEQINKVIGDFTTPVLLSVNVDDGMSFAERANLIQKQLVSDMEHPYFGGVLVQRELTRKNGSMQTIPVVFTSTVGFGSLDTSKLIGNLTYTATQTPQIWLDFQVMEVNGNVEISFEAVKELFAEGMPQEILDGCMSVLSKLAENHDNWNVRSKSLVDIKYPLNRESEHVTVPELTLDELFVKSAIRYSDKPAIISHEKTLSYMEVFSYAYEISKHVVEDSIVAIIMEKGWQQIVSAIGVIMGGGAYMAIDPNNPVERRKKIYHSSGASLLLTQSWLKDEQTSFESEKVYCIDTIVPDNTKDINCFKSKAGFNKRAYVIFTSGSTGVPKGVVISNHGAVNTILDVNSRFNITDEDRAIAISNLNFDLSVYDIFGMLAAGGAIVVPEKKKQKYPDHWMQLIKKYRVSVWNTVPAFMQMMTEYSEAKSVKAINGLKTVMLSGDWIPLELPDTIRNAFGESIKIISLGGATEASIWSNYFYVNKIEKEWKSIPYGYPLTNQKFRILNNQLLDCPANVIGRLFIGGEGLAMCYLNDKQKTDEKFIIHPTSGERLYDTGDLGKFWPDGTIEFIGRNDFQVKIRGHRIELGEIENALLQQENIQKATALVTSGANGKKFIAACVVVKSAGIFDEEKINGYIKNSIPGYMIPEVYCVVKNFELTNNGKIDRKKLQKIVSDAVKLKYEAKKEIASDEKLTHTEKEVADVWGEVLQIVSPDIHEDFFDQGGDSILMVKFINLLQERCGYNVSIGCVFEEQNIQGIATRIDDGTSSED